ncbi:MAG: prephenate dehydrogenase/arogenate dehydrogenase family protein [Alphaproteobacteria bacterium]
MFQKIAIIGIGLMGSSLARAVRKAGLATEIVAVDQNAENIQTALDLGVIDASENVFQGADLIVFATPVGAFKTAAKEIAPLVDAAAIITDLGSVKGTVVEALKPYFDEKNIVPAHPIAGSEKAGPEHGRADLFQERWCVLTPSEKTDADAVARLKAFWEALGSQVEIMSAKRHDLTLAMTSHLPHLISYGLVDTAVKMEGRLKEDIIRFSAGGFRDFTRLAGSDPVMWRDICLENKGALLEMLGHFKDDIAQLETLIQNDQGDALEALFEKTRAVRQKVVDAKQDADERGCR